MEWSILSEWFLILAKWFFAIIFFTFSFILACIAILTGITAFDERKIYKEKDDSWRIFLLIAIVAGAVSFLFGLAGYLII